VSASVRIAVLAALLLAVAGGQRAAAQHVTDVVVSPCAAGCEPFKPLGWEGEYRSERVEFRSERSGARLRGTLFAPPAGIVKRGASYPGVVIVPGSSNTAREEHYHWSARELAAHGYVVLGVDPQGVGHSGAFGEHPCEADEVTKDPEYPYPCRGVPFQERANFNDAAESGLGFLLSGDDPYRSILNPEELGLAGHSLGGGTVSELQDEDPRVKSVVAWDSLHADHDGTDQCGPTSHAISAHVPQQIYRPLAARRPALSLTSELECQTFYDRNPDSRTVPYRHWRAAGVPVMVIVMNGVQHTDYGQFDSTAPGSEADLKLQRFEWFTRAWFDRFLKGQHAAEERLVAPKVVGLTRDELLSRTWHSAAYLPSASVDCTDLRACPALDR
jgi:dienelactone hydrolase